MNEFGEKNVGDISTWVNFVVCYPTLYIPIIFYFMTRFAIWTGTNRTELHNTDMLHIYGLTLLGQHLYWTDTQRRTLDRINKDTGQDRQPVVEQIAHMMGVKAIPRRGTSRCPLGLELGTDRKTCSEPEAFLVYSRKNMIGHISIENENNDAVLPIKDFEGIHVSGSKIYWSDIKTKTINRCSVDGSNHERILEWVGLVEGLAIDWSEKQLIWQGLKKPKSIVLDPKKGQMYWSELGSKTIKARGNGRVVGDGLGRASGACACPHAGLRASRFVLGGLRTARDRARHVGRQLALGHRRRPVHAVRAHAVRGAPVLGATGTLAMSNRSQCDVDNGGCSHLCVPTHGSYRCACPTHYRLGRDNLTCTEPEDFLLFAQKNALGRILAIEYDPVKKLLYWMDDDSHSIRRVPISYSTTSVNTDSNVLVERLPRPFHMVLDVLGRALYWTCLESDSINATSIDVNSSTGIIVRGENMMPRHLAFHQTKRVLVWNDVGLGAIMRSNVDGTEREELARASNASALALDQATGVVYWAGNRQIHAIDLDTLNKRVIWQGGWVGTLAAYNGALYLSGGERALMRLPLHRRDAPAALVPHAARLAASVAVYPHSKSNATKPGWAYVL
ncbi:hypothetical protein ACJJTC_007075 [Scirpophaga incertulas]